MSNEGIAKYIREDFKTTGPHSARSPGDQERIEVGSLFDLFQHLVKLVGKSVDKAEGGT